MKFFVFGIFFIPTAVCNVHLNVPRSCNPIESWKCLYYESTGTWGRVRNNFKLKFLIKHLKTQIDCSYTDIEYNYNQILLSRVHEACKDHVLNLNVQIFVTGENQKSYFSSGFTLDLFENSNWTRIFVYLSNIDLVQIQKCGKYSLSLN